MRRLFVEIETLGSHDDQLRESAETGLASVKFTTPVDKNGDVALQVELVGMQPVGEETTCQIKILVLRASTNDLLGIADGSARARGTHDQAGDDCIRSLGATLIRGKVRTVLKRQLDMKR